MTIFNVAVGPVPCDKYVCILVVGCVKLIETKSLNGEEMINLII